MKKTLLCTIIFITGTSLQSNQSIESCIKQPLHLSMFLHDNPGLIVDWSFKSACTSVLEMLVRGYGLLPEVEKFARVRKLYGAKKFWLYGPVFCKKNPITIEKFLDPHYCKVKFVRNPYKRIVSSYIHNCKNFRLKMSFEQFLTSFKYQNWKGYLLSKRKIKLLNWHTQKQSKLTDQYMDFIIQIENPDLTEVNARTGLNLSLTKPSFAHHHEYLESCNKYVGNLPFIKMKKYPPFYCYYSHKTLNLVEELFQEDIEKFGYSRPQEIIDFIAQTDS